jgi:hypothetical protein
MIGETVVLVICAVHAASL